MKINRALLLLFLLCICSAPYVFSQTNYVVINSITIAGNNKTKEHIITRELDFEVGDTLLLQDTATVIRITKNKLFNTHLFNSTVVYFIPYNQNQVNVFIEVDERWYIWPAPIFELGDRNFNEWWADRGKKLDRLQYGMRFRMDNFRGRKEELKAVAQFGFTEKFELFHTIPYINKKQTLGIKYGASYSVNTKVAYATVDDKLAYFNGTSANRRRFYALLSFISRPKFYTTHELTATFKDNTITDTIAQLNNNYFLNGNTKQKFLELFYEYRLNNTDIRAYPLNGTLFFTNLSSLVGDVTLTTAISSFTWFKAINTRLFFASKIYGKATNTKNIPYFNMIGMGYQENFVRGFERQVINAQHFAYSRNSVRWQFLKIKQDINYMLPLEELNEIPYTFYFTTFVDAGISRLNTLSPYNYLNNQGLFSAGIGLDIVTYYDLVFRLEYALTNKNTNGFYIHFEQAF